ncbi:glycosyl hydrolase catalytic core-domain-containing protein [Massariosphaeria phaeospora]|uniref:Glycosyl hydrolase catalytic core-domain-containing protein n=1 Tax=Massariosphaeria phaeospora TaxID=100035 RepID=A0A7C8IET8_9PLEO|nr:glycosyl hydrolase catalytic core-domain-containing protein [Massariosphaeria phaeospora]
MLPLSTLLVALPLVLATTAPKRGLCHVPSDDHPTDDTIWTAAPNSPLTWYYNYKSEPSQAYASDHSLQFIPMLWGASATDTGTPFLDSVRAQRAAGRNISHVLGFNEPDGWHSVGGSDMPPALAASVWRAQLEPLRVDDGIKVGAPAVMGSPDGFIWLEQWFSECKGGCNPDFIPVHFYGDFEALANHIGQIMGTYPGLDVWVTEWAYPRKDLETTKGFFNTSTEWFDRMENITRYSYFGAFRSDVSNVGPNAAMLTEQGKLTDIGSWYLGGAATNNAPKEGGAGRAARFSGWALVVIGMGMWVWL